MTEPKSVTLWRTNNVLIIEPSTPEVKGLLIPQLRFIEKKFFHGAELAERKRLGLSRVETITWDCFSLDHKDRLATSYGFLDRVNRVLYAAGYEVNMGYATQAEADVAAQRVETAYKPRWDRIDQVVAAGFEFRYMQRECLELIAASECGRIDCPPGWGKGSVIRLAATLFVKAKIDVVTKRCAVILQRLLPELRLNLPSVGVVGCGQRVTGRRVMVYSADSLHHARPDADIVFIDEGDQAGATNFSTSLGMYRHARIFMFSASWDGRLDGADLRTEALAGPIILRVPYQEAQAHGMVVPIEVRWSDVIMDVNPCEGLKDQVKKKKVGIWTNSVRNGIIAADVASDLVEFGPDTQMLITVETLEHALHLKQLLPQFDIVYNGSSVKPNAWERFFEQELIDANFKIIDQSERDRLTKGFEAGTITKVIATTVWNVGVNFHRLQVLYRADAGGSPNNDTQIPGRNSRPHVEEGVKPVGIIRDYLDQFDTGFRKKAAGRETSYEKHGWTQVHPDRSKQSSVRQRMGWGEAPGGST